MSTNFFSCDTAAYDVSAMLEFTTNYVRSK